MKSNKGTKKNISWLTKNLIYFNFEMPIKPGIQLNCGIWNNNTVYVKIFKTGILFLTYQKYKINSI